MKGSFIFFVVSLVFDCPIFFYLSAILFSVPPLVTQCYHYGFILWVWFRRSLDTWQYVPGIAFWGRSMPMNYSHQMFSSENIYTSNIKQTEVSLLPLQYFNTYEIWKVWGINYLGYWIIHRNFPDYSFLVKWTERIQLQTIIKNLNCPI